MSFNKYIMSLTTIPSRINSVENTIQSLVEQTLKPEKIVLNLPKIYNFRFNSSIQDFYIKKILNKYNDKIIINYVDHDYGPGTKLLGLIKSKIIDMDSKDTYIVLVDDDHIYKPYMLEYFDIYNKINFDNKLEVSSYYCYNYHNIIIVGQGADGFFIKPELLNKFEDYYNIIKDYDYINYHDDYYISNYFHLKQIPINFIKPPYDSLIYVKDTSSYLDALTQINDKYHRDNLNIEVNKILSELKNEGKFDNIIYDRI